MVKILAEVWIHSDAVTGEPCEVSIHRIKSDEFLGFDFLQYLIDYPLEEQTEEFSDFSMDEWHIAELYYDCEDGEWYFEGAKNTEQPDELIPEGEK